MPTEREYFLRLYLGKMDELGNYLKLLPVSKRDKAILLHDSIRNYLQSHIEQEHANE